MQLGSLAFLFVFSTSIAFLISPLAAAASFDGAWCILLASVPGTALTAAALGFAMRRPDRYVGQYGERIVGRVAHKLILTIAAFFFLHLTAYILREFMDFFIPAYLQETPPAAVGLLIMAAVAALAQSGISAVFRFAQGVFIFVGLLFVIKPLFFLSSMQTPMWHEFVRLHDWKAIWGQTYGIVPWYGELVLLGYLAPQFGAKQRMRSSLWKGAMAGTYILVVEFVLIIVFFGPKLTGVFAYPALELTGFLQLGDFLHNPDALIVSIWFTGFFVKLSVIFATGTLLCSQVLGLKDHKTISFPLAVAVVMLSLVLAGNSVKLERDFNDSWATFALFAEGLIFVYPFVSWLRGRGSAASSDRSPAK